MKLITLLFIVIGFFIKTSYAETNIKQEAKEYFAYCTLPFTLILSVPFVLTYEVTHDFSGQNEKVIIAAKLDAYAYIAADGRDFYSIYLEKAFMILREKYPNSKDLELAKAIIAY